jgi:hypothetical protein
MQMLELKLTISSWELCYNIAPDYSEGDAKPAILASSRWLGGTASAELVESKNYGHNVAFEVIAAARKIAWTIHPDKKVNAKGETTAIESETDRSSGSVGIAELNGSDGFVEVVALGARSFEWIVRALEARNSSIRNLTFTAERTERGTLRLLGMSLRNGEL